MKRLLMPVRRAVGAALWWFLEPHLNQGQKVEAEAIARRFGLR
ncbi:MAG TPA: hypothetical protein PLK13_11885 [Xanthobacteraceae bacterium]|jgi:hypothetical protein|nr:hypothetical protein [Xanthobacteraceae bacterium]HQS46810.1 hypothetical protein [Xanthobacteraceae bacterium]